MKAKQIGKRIAKAFGWVITGILILLLCFQVYLFAAKQFFGVRQPTVFGFTNAVVLTGSMEDAIHVNDMVIIHAQKDYEIKDVITYLPVGEGTPVTHRIIKKDGNTFVTKGDANNTSDPEIQKEQIVGKVILVIPKIGLLIQAMQTPLGMLVLLLVGIILFEWPNLIGFFKKRKSETNNT